MESDESAVLPYRTDAELLARWLEARARGRAPAQIRSLDFGAKAYEGTLAGAQALGFVHAGRTELTEAGQAYALAPPETRPELLRAALVAYEPYGLLLEALAARGGVESTETAWIETWWATHGYGASATNRAEGAVAFARFADFVGLGSYVQGRRGHPSRIEWASTKARAAASATAWGDLWSTLPPPSAALPAQPPRPRAERPDEVRPSRPPVEPAPPPATGTLPVASEHPGAAEASRAASAHNSAVVDLGGGRIATLRVPAVVSEAEKARLMELLQVLLATPGA